MLEEKCMNKWMSEHQTNELLPPLGIWALWGWRLIFITHVNTTQSITGSWFLPAVPAIDTQPGDEAWKMEGLSAGPGAFPSLLFTAPRTALLLWVWGSVAAARSVGVADWLRRHGHVELAVCWGDLGPARFMLRGPCHANLADEPWLAAAGSSATRSCHRAAPGY